MTGRGRPPRERLYERLEIQIDELKERLGGLPTPLEAEEVWRGIWYEEAHHSTAIEGNALVLKQVQALLAEGRAVGNRQLREYLEVQGYSHAADWVYHQAIAPEMEGGGLLTLTEVRHVHRLAMLPVWEVAPHTAAGPDEAPGGFRCHEIRQFPGGMRPAPWTEVPARMDEWVRAARRLRAGTDRFPERIAELHGDFERIHPFLDGNGRVGRLLMNLLLIRLGYPPAIIYKRDRSRYLGALRGADRGEPRPLGELIARAVLDNLHRFVVPALAGPARLVPLAALAGKEISAAALRIAAIRGRLQATRGADGQWRSTRRWVDEYLESRYERS